MKKLTLEIKTCSDCPYNVYHEFDDVGTSFGMDWACSLDEKANMLTLKETQEKIRDNCSLKDG